MKIKSFYPKYHDGVLRLELQTSTHNMKFSIGAGESEDMTLTRDLSDALKIEGMLVEAYRAGQRGETLEQESLKEGK